MKLLILSGPVFPQPGNNANLIGKLIPILRERHQVQLASLAAQGTGDDLPKTCFGVNVHWIRDEKQGLIRRFLVPAYARIADRGGYSDAVMVYAVRKVLAQLRREYAFDAIISTCEPFYAAAAAAGIPGVKKVLYLMDPPELVSGSPGTHYRNGHLAGILAKQDTVVTTPFIREALAERGIVPRNVISVGFPMVEPHNAVGAFSGMDQGKINLLFCGWLYSSIRSPAYFLKLAEVLDDRFCIWFMGKECDRVAERFSFHTEAEVRVLPQQPYAIALAAMAQADILINIGNSVPVHMPSKTLEYINTGKPFVNFYKMDDCPTLYYTKRYPLCLNLFEGEQDVDAAKQQFLSFCLEQRGKTVERSRIEAEFPDCTTRYIGEKIMEALQ